MKDLTAHFSDSSAWETGNQTGPKIPTGSHDNRHFIRLKNLSQTFSRLSDRERVVLEMVLAGKPNKSIAFRLDCSKRTIEYDRARVLKKLGVGTMSEAIFMAAEFTVLKSMLYDRQQGK